jgi:hypothetical protein
MPTIPIPVTYEPLYFDPRGSMRLGPALPNEEALELYLSATPLPRNYRMTVRLRRQGGRIAWRALGGAWIEVRSIYDVPAPDVAALRPSRAVFGGAA